jgi:hypothetical protein
VKTVETNEAKARGQRELARRRMGSEGTRGNQHSKEMRLEETRKVKTREPRDKHG